MALRNKAIEMRKKGMSYTQIKSELDVSKGTLGIWLRDHPLSADRIEGLRDRKEQRIERCRETKLRKYSAHLKEVEKAVAEDIGILTERDLYLSGLFLYWAEGTKAARGVVQLTNTDPAMLKFFIQWLELVGVPRSKLKIKLHLYSDMHAEDMMTYWSAVLDVEERQFMKPYIKTSSEDKRRNYKGRFGTGTCSVTVHNTVLYERIMAGIAHISGVTISPAV